MKSKKYTVLLFWLANLICSIAYSQRVDTIFVNGKPQIYIDGVNTDNGQSPLKKDDYLLEVSYGYPFMPLREAAVFGLDLFSNVKTNKTTRNLNHICLRTSYQLNSEFDVGLEFTYASQQLDYYRTFIINSTTRDSLFSIRMSKVRFLAKIGYHLNISDRFDAYGTAGFGYKQFNYTSKDTYLNTANIVNQILPLAIRASIGGRFFLNENVAVHVEGGIGGPLMQLGLTYKLHSYYYKNLDAKSGKSKG